MYKIECQLDLKKIILNKTKGKDKEFIDSNSLYKAVYIRM